MKDIKIYPWLKGANWFSITHNLAEYTVSKKKRNRENLFEFYPM